MISSVFTATFLVWWRFERKGPESSGGESTRACAGTHLYKVSSRTWRREMKQDFCWWKWPFYTNKIWLHWRYLYSHSSM